VGRIYLAVAVLLVPPALVSLAFRDFHLALVAAGVAAALAGAGWILQRGGAGEDIQANEAMAVTALVFLTVPLWVTPIFLAAGLAPGQALFEATAAVTTAGLTMFASVGDLPPAFLFIRAWIQWFGGLGFVALSAALVIGPGVAARRIAMEFDRDPVAVSGTHARTRRVLAVYAALSVVAFAALWAASRDPFAALVHALAGVATGGYSSFDAGAAGFPSPVSQAVLMLVCVLGALSFDLHGRLHRRPWPALARDPALRALVLAIATVAVLVALLEPGAGAFQALGLAVMAQTTAGFTTHPFTELGPATQGVLALSMLVGGDIGSTAGGIKLLRVIVLLRLVQLLIARTALPRHAVTAARVEGRRVLDSEVVALLAFVALLGLVIAVSWLVFVASGQPPFASLLEVVAAVSTGGLSAGLTGPELAGHLKLVLALDMLAGRLEVVALVVLCYPGTWVGRRQVQP